MRSLICAATGEAELIDHLENEGNPVTVIWFIEVLTVPPAEVHVDPVFVDLYNESPDSTFPFNSVSSYLKQVLALSPVFMVGVISKIWLCFLMIRFVQKPLLISVLPRFGAVVNTARVRHIQWRWTFRLRVVVMYPPYACDTVFPGFKDILFGAMVNTVGSKYINLQIESVSLTVTGPAKRVSGWIIYSKFLYDSCRLRIVWEIPLYSFVPARSIKCSLLLFIGFEPLHESLNVETFNVPPERIETDWIWWFDVNNHWTVLNTASVVHVSFSNGVAPWFKI